MRRTSTHTKNTDKIKVTKLKLAEVSLTMQIEMQWCNSGAADVNARAVAPKQAHVEVGAC